MTGMFIIRALEFCNMSLYRNIHAKRKRIKKPYARKIQILTVVEQRAKFGGKPIQAKIAKKGKEALKKQRKKVKK